MSIIGTALSGMRVSQTRLTASASNVANASASASNAGPISAPVTFGPIGMAQDDPGLYRPVRVEQTSSGTGGVAARIVPVGQPSVLRYQPDAISADVHGMVAAPNVDLAQEAAEQLAAVQQFKANAKVAQTAQTLSRSTLEIWG